MLESLDSKTVSRLTSTLVAAYPDLQGIYVYGSSAEDTSRADSDIDVAVLLPHQTAAACGSLALSDARFRLERTLLRRIGLVNARISPIVLQKEIVASGVCVFARDPIRIDEYEMLVLWLYGKLNEERKEILEAFRATGRAYPV